MITRFLSSLLFNIARLISFLPFSWLYSISRFVAFILRKPAGYRKSVIIQNLSRSFPGLRYREINAISDAFYLHFADVFTEVIKSISLPRSAMKKRFRIENPEVLMQYYHDNRNIIGLTGHLANWEWLSIVPSLYPFNCYTLYKPLRSKVAEGIMTRIRLRFGMKLLPMSNAARYILSHKEGKALYIFIGDQSPARVENAHQFNFLNQQTTFFTGGAKLAKATKAAVVYISIRKVIRGYYTVRFIPIDVEYNEKPVKQTIDTVQKPGKDMAETVSVKLPDTEIGILENYARLLEEDIKANPVHWLWSHKRWKH
jgi:Kdo2-lipid IVA lauroyltransferase/acyltransferase